MADYDYTNAEFRRWWADLWVSYVTDIGVDGYRVDISLQDPVLWTKCVSEAQPRATRSSCSGGPPPLPLLSGRLGRIQPGSGP